MCECVFVCTRILGLEYQKRAHNLSRMCGCVCRVLPLPTRPRSAALPNNCSVLLQLNFHTIGRHWFPRTKGATDLAPRTRPKETPAQKLAKAAKKAKARSPPGFLCCYKDGCACMCTCVRTCAFCSPLARLCPEARRAEPACFILHVHMHTRILHKHIRTTHTRTHSITNSLLHARSRTHARARALSLA